MKPVTALLAAATLAAVASTTGPRDDASAAPRDGEHGATRPAHAAPAATTFRPFYFETNRGQAPAEFDLVVRCDGYRAWVGSQGIVVAGRERGIRLAFDGAAKVPADTAGRVIPGHVSYLIGKDESKWLREIPVTDGATWRDVTPGADLTVGGDGRRLEFGFDLAPGAKPPSMTVTGATEIRVTDAGELRAESPEGAATFSAPIAWQETETGRRPVAARWAVTGGAGVAFVLGAHDESLPVTIDPTVSWLTFLGGGASESSSAVDVGVNGDVYIAGTSYSVAYPTTTGAFDTTKNGVSGRNDVVVTRMAKNGATLVYSTYIGGLLDETVLSIQSNATGDALITGYTYDGNFPTTPTAYATGSSADSYLTCLNAAGTGLVWSTYTLTGNLPRIARFSPVSGAYFMNTHSLYKFKNDGSGLTWSYRIVPSTTSVGLNTSVNGMTVDAYDGIWVCGTTNAQTITSGTYQSAYKGNSDGFLMKFGADGTKILTGVAGGTNDEAFSAVTTDAGGRPIVVGISRSSDYPTTLGAVETSKSNAGFVIVVSRFDAEMKTLRGSSYFAGAYGFEPTSIDCHPSGAYTIGGYCGAGLPVVDAFQSTHGGGSDGFLARFGADDSRTWVSYVGGSGAESVTGVAMGPDGSVAAIVDSSSSSVTTTSAYQSTNAGEKDHVIVSVGDSLSPYSLPVVAAQTLPGTTVGVPCPHSLAASGGVPPYTWNPIPLSGALPAALFADTAGKFVGSPTVAGTYQFRMQVADSYGGLADNVVTLTVNKVATPNGAGVPQWTVNVPCDLGLILKDGSPPFTYEFVSGTLPAGLTLDAAGRLKGTPTSTGNHAFTARFTDSVGAVSTGTFTARINPPPTIPAQSIPPATTGAAFNYDMLVSSGTAPFTWAVVGGTSPVVGGIQSDGELGVTAAAAGDYSFTLRATDAAGVTAQRTFSATVNAAPSITTPRLPPASTGRRYRSQLTAIDGTPPFTWEITNGAAVDGLVFQPESGTFLGTPLSHGRIPIALRATDRWGAQAERTIEIDVATPVDLTKRAAGETIQLPVGKAPPFFRALELLAGTKLSISVSGGAYDGDAADVTLTGQDGQPIDLAGYERITTKSVTIRNFPVPATGRYFLLVEPQEGAKGKVKLKVTTTQQSAWSGTVDVDAAGSPVPVVFSAPPGAKLNISVTRAKGSAATPSIAGLTDEDDTDLVAGGKLAEKKTSASLRPAAPLALGGDLTLLLGARDGTAGAVNWKVTFAPPRSNDFELPDLTAGDE